MFKVIQKKVFKVSFESDGNKWLKRSTFATSLRKIFSRLCMSDFFLKTEYTNLRKGLTAR